MSILFAPNINWLSRRTNGLIQLTYSLIIGYALFLTVSHASRRQIAGLFLGFALIILMGCLLESHAGFRPVSDAVRNVLYSKGVYENDLRDLLFYNRVRPKFFASEPASVTFCYTLFSFIWLVSSPGAGSCRSISFWSALGLLAMPGPTLLLMLVLLLPYLLFLGSRRRWPHRCHALSCRRHGRRAVCADGAAAGHRPCSRNAWKSVTSGNDPSFFYRVQGPALAGLDIMGRYPITGAGLTGEPFIEREITNLYLRSPYYSAGWQIVSPSTELLINYFWLHWIYLGFVWGVVMIAVISRWLRILGVPSVAFCWVTWAILGQASGAYVGPTCWAVLFLAGAAAILHQRAPTAAPLALRLSLQERLLRRRGGGHAPAPSDSAASPSDPFASAN